MSELTQQQVIDYLMGENGTFSERKSARIAVNLIEEQQAEIDALKARVERLLIACQSAHGSYGKTLLSDPPQDAWKANQVTAKLVEAIAATPQQSLAEHHANTVLVFTQQTIDKIAKEMPISNAVEWDYFKMGVRCFVRAAENYANKIKAGDL